MMIENLILKNFRAHTHTEIGFSEGINIVHGPNGAGKTNLLEAIHYLCLTKSFLTSSDQYVLRRDTSFFQLDGSFRGEKRSQMDVRLIYAGRDGKRAFINGSPIDRLSRLVGQLPVVVYSPEDQTLTTGGPDERRRFLNNIISQSSAVYLTEVMRYRRTLRQRNEILTRAKRSRAQVREDVLATYTEILVQSGTAILASRRDFLLSFAKMLRNAYEQLQAIVEEPRMVYRPFRENIDSWTRESIETRFRSALDETRDRERERGGTLVGPHRDEVVFYLNDMDVRRYASQGQHRTFGLAMKLAQFEYLRQKTGEAPLMLLDDIFDNLDRDRINIFLEILEADGSNQCIITAARKDIFNHLVDFNTESNRLIEINPVPSDTEEISSGISA